MPGYWLEGIKLWNQTEKETVPAELPTSPDLTESQSKENWSVFLNTSDFCVHCIQVMFPYIHSE